MSLHLTEEEFAALQRRYAKSNAQTGACDAEKPAVPKRRKYGNEPTDVDGERFDSRHEARVYERSAEMYRQSRYADDVRSFLNSGADWVEHPIQSRERLKPEYNGLYMAIDRRFRSDAYVCIRGGRIFLVRIGAILPDSFRELSKRKGK